MNIQLQLKWNAVAGAESYQIAQLNLTGGEDPLTSTVDTEYLATIDELQDYVFMIRAYDGAYYHTPIQIVYNKPLTLAAIRDMVRIELKAPLAKWPDAELNQYVQEAITDYSRYFPISQSVQIDCEADTSEYALPVGLQMVQRVEYVTTEGVSMFLQYRPWKSGEATGFEVDTDRLGRAIGSVSSMGNMTRYYRGHYDYRAGVLELDFRPVSGSYLVVRYTSTRTIPPLDAARIDVPREHAELLVLYACGKAQARVEVQDASLSRWTEESGRRDDNPLAIPTNRFFTAYREKISALRNRPRFIRRSRV